VTSRRAKRRRGRDPDQPSPTRGPPLEVAGGVDVGQVAAGTELEVRASAGPQTPESCPDWPLWSGGAGGEHFTAVAVAPSPAGLQLEPAATPHDCMPAAFEYTVANAHLDPLLVHGTITSPADELVYTHAWVVLGGPDGETVFDPIAGEHYQRADYDGKLAAVACFSYTPADALEHLRVFGTTGPWEYWAWHEAAVQKTLNALTMARPDVAAWIARKRATDPVFADLYDTLAAANPEGQLHVFVKVLREPWRMAN
jgi:hypothetical protein